jgi:hypothetical protein
MSKELSNHFKIDVDYELDRIKQWLRYVEPDQLKDFEIELMDMWEGPDWKSRYGSKQRIFKNDSNQE